MNSIQQPAHVLASSGGSLEQLTAQAKAGDARSIERVAEEFESLFVSMVLKEMRQTLEPGTLFGSDSSDSYGGLFDMYLSSHVVRAGGLGVGKMVREYLAKRS
jgi:Rod binding domain-containing protein